MPRARAPFGDWFLLARPRARFDAVPPSAPRGATWLSLFALVVPGCSLSGEGTGGHTERMLPTESAGEGDAEVAGPGARRDAGLDARVPAGEGGLDASPLGDAGQQAVPVPIDAAASDSAVVVIDDGGPPDPGPMALDAAAVDAAPVDAGTSDTGAPDAGLDCSLAAEFAVRFDFQVHWEGTELEGVIPVLAPGTGVLTMFSSLDLRTKDTAVIAPCGTITPDFTSSNSTYRGEVYSVYVPDAAWESAQMPRWQVGYSSACEQPGCAFSVQPLLSLLGARSVPPVSPGTTPTVELADHDGDGQPGVTLLARGPASVNASGKPYAYPPLFAPWVRARKMMLAMSINTKLDGAVSGCGTVSGAVNQAVFEQGAVACTGVIEGNPAEQNCSSQFVTFLDDNMPKWTVSSAAFKMQRIGTSSCAAVRAALP